MALPMMKSRPIRDPAEIPLPTLDAATGYRPAADAVAAHEKRYQQAEKREKVAEARLRGQTPTTTNDERADALVAGGSIVNLPAEAELMAAREEKATLSEAIGQKKDRVAEIAGKVEYEANKALTPPCNEAMLQILEHLKGLNNCHQVIYAALARLTAAGYKHNLWGLPLPLLKVLVDLGDPDRYGTPAWTYKQGLIAKGILK